MSSIRAFSVALSLIAITTAAPVAQQRSGQGAGPGDPVTVEFRARTDDGSPVTDLTISDVVIKVAGRQRTIGRIQLFQFGEGAPTSPIAPPFATNVPPASGIHDSILVIDDQSIVPGDDKRLGPAVDQYLAGLGPSARVGIATIMDRGLNVDPTSDRDVIRRAVKAIVGRAAATEPAGESACRTRRVLDALSTLATRFPPGSAPASVLLFTTGLTAPSSSVQLSRIGNVGSGAPSAVCEVESRNYQAFQKLLLASSANLHVVEAALAPSQPMRAGLEMLAGVSGNTLTQVVSGDEGALSGLANEMRGWYRATFVPEPGERTDDVQRVEVTSKRAGVKTDARSQVLIPRLVSTTQPKEPKDMLREPRVYRDLELRAAAYFSQEPGSDRVNVLVLFEPIDDGVKLTAASVALYDTAGTLKVQGTADAAALGRSPGTLALATGAGKYRLRVAAVDNRGRAGTVDEPVDVGLVSAGALKLGSLVPGVQEGTFSARLAFSGADTAMAYVPLYGTPAPGAPLQAVMEITDSTGTKLGVAPTQILDAPDGSHVIIGGLRLASLAAGDYQMKILVALNGLVVGQTSHTFRRK
jgi:hypothetical protein